MEHNKKDWLVITSLLSFNSISILGNVISEVAIPWLILEMTGSAAYVGVLIGLKFIPVFFSMMLGGALIDHYGQYRTSQYADLLNFFAVAMIPLFFMFNILNLGFLLLFILLSALLDGPGRAAKDILLATEINRRNLPHEKINGINSFLENISDLAGPLLAGILISFVGVANALFFDAVTFLVPIIGLILIRKLLTQSTTAANQKKKFKLSNSFSGFQMIWQQQELKWVLVLSTTVNTTVSTLIFVFLPIFVNGLYGDATQLGVILSCFAFGTISASICYGLWGKYFDFRKTLILANLTMALSFISLNFISALPYFALNMSVLGFAIGFTGPSEATYLQKNVKATVQGKVFATFYALRMVFVPITMMITGFYLQSLGILSPDNMPHLLLFFGVAALLSLMFFVVKTKSAAFTKTNI